MKQTLCIRLRKAILSFFLMNNVFVSKKMKRKRIRKSRAKSLLSKYYPRLTYKCFKPKKSLLEINDPNFFFFLVKRYDILKHKRDYKLAIEAKVVAICLKQYSSLTSDTRSLSNSSEGEDSKITKSSLRQQPFLAKKSAHWFISLYICVTRTCVAFAMRNLQP